MKKKPVINAACCIILCLLALASCKKESLPIDKSGYLKMKVNGVQKEYDSCWTLNFQQSISTTQTYYQLSIKSGIPGDYAGVGVSDIQPIKGGTYTSVINSVIGLPMAALGAYREPGSTDIYISYQAGWPLYDISITFSEFNSEYVSGTFRGKLRLVGGTTLLDVTEGEFKAYNH